MPEAASRKRIVTRVENGRIGRTMLSIGGQSRQLFQFAYLFPTRDVVWTPGTKDKPWDWPWEWPETITASAPKSAAAHLGFVYTGKWLSGSVLYFWKTFFKDRPWRRPMETKKITAAAIPQRGQSPCSTQGPHERNLTPVKSKACSPKASGTG
jgi:hypothetical protein